MDNNRRDCTDIDVQFDAVYNNLHPEFQPNKDPKEKDPYFYQLVEIISGLSVSALDVPHIKKRACEYVQKLDKLFENGYSRNYSDAYYILKKINIPYEDTDSFSEKCKILYAYCSDIEKSQESNIKHLSDIKKLLDYFMLECTRVHEYDSFKKKEEEMMKIIDEYNTSKEDAKGNVERSITMFSIFSAVIITFSTGFSLSTEIIKGIVSTSPYRIVFLLSLLGFILFNTVFMLLYVVSRMTNRSISLKCSHLSDQTLACHEACTKKCKRHSYLCMLYHKYPYILAVDAILIGLMLLVGFLWALVQPSNLHSFLSSCRWMILSLIFLVGIILVIIYSIRHHSLKQTRSQPITNSNQKNR